MVLISLDDGNCDESRDVDINKLTTTFLSWRVFASPKSGDENMELLLLPMPAMIGSLNHLHNHDMAKGLRAGH